MQNNNDLQLMLLSSFTDTQVYYNEELKILYGFKHDQLIYRVHLRVYDCFEIVKKKAELLFKQLQQQIYVY